MSPVSWARRVLAHNRDHWRLAKSCRRLCQRVEHRLEIKTRAANDLEHLGGGCLLLQRFAQLVEQPRILDGDHGLIGKGLEQSDLSLREELRLAAAECDRANRDTLSHQRDAK